MYGEARNDIYIIFAKNPDVSNSLYHSDGSPISLIAVKHSKRRGKQKIKMNSRKNTQKLFNIHVNDLPGHFIINISLKRDNNLPQSRVESQYQIHKTKQSRSIKKIRILIKWFE